MIAECDCPCHLSGIYGGTSCPFDCRNAGLKLDGCHRCGCPGSKCPVGECKPFHRFTKCLICGKPLAEFSIAWSELPDNEKCRCKNPAYPPGPLEQLLQTLARAWKSRRR